MTQPDTIWALPPHVDEHEDAHYWPGGAYDGPADDDCVFCSGVMQYLAHKPEACPATLYEAERVRQSAGLAPSGPAGSADLIRGMNKRHGWAPREIPRGFAALWAALTPGTSATASGRPHDCPLTSPFRRFLRYWDGGHRVFIARLDTTDRVWLMDPEGPKTGYDGQWATKAQLATFVKNGSTHTIATMASKGEPMVTITDKTPKQVATSPGAVYYDLNGAKVTAATSSTTRISPYGTAIGRVISVHRTAANIDQMLLVKPGDPAVKISDVPPPPDYAKGFDDGRKKAAAAAAVVQP